MVQKGRRRIYDRIRAGLIWGIEVIGMVGASTPGVGRVVMQARVLLREQTRRLLWD